MGEIELNRSGRLLGALTVAAAVGALLTSCSGLAGAGTSAPTEAVPVVESSAATPEATASASSSPDATPAATPETTAAAKAQVEPFVTAVTVDGNSIDVGALVPKVVESGGTCTATASKDGVEVTASGDAAPAASYTGCPQLVLKGDDLTDGTWTVTVAYSSADSAGASAARTVTVG